MDLYKFHSKSAILQGYKEADDIVPSRIIKLARSGKQLTSKQEDAIAKDPKSAYHYAVEVLHTPFPKGEAAIAKDWHYAYWYAHYILKKPFPAGEAAISTNAGVSWLYAKNILKKRFLKGESAIANDESLDYKSMYEEYFKVKL